jgi:predicted GNAT superfamily acetyltransferase
MNDSEPRSIATADLLRDEALAKALLALNNAHAQELSWLEGERLEYLMREAFLARRIGHLDAFLLAFDQDARYDSPNFIWFRARYPRFVYVDRIVVAPSARTRLRATAL